jgi:hypothetical protein
MVQHLNAAAIESLRARKKLVDAALEMAIAESNVDSGSMASFLSSISQDANGDDPDNGDDSHIKRIRGKRIKS